jgi:hypothetical protein
MSATDSPPTSTPTQPRREVARALISTAGGTAIGFLIVLGTFSLGSTSSHTPIAGAFGPIQLNETTPNAPLSFPKCILVSVHWWVTEGGVTNFSAWVGGPALPWGCTGHEGSCPGDQSPGTTSYGGFPVCFQTGTSGAFSVMPDRGGFDFVLGYGYGDEAAGHAIDFAGNYSCPEGELDCGS